MATNARTVAHEVLLRIDRDDAYSHVALDAQLRKAKLEPRDRGLATRLVYGTLAMQRRLDVDLERFLRGSIESSTDPFVRAVLRAATYQIRHLDRVPDHAAVDAAVDAIKTKKNRKAAGFANAVLRNVIRQPWTPGTTGDPVLDFAIAHSLPDWLADWALNKFGQDAERWAETINAESRVTLRATTSRMTQSALLEKVDGVPTQSAKAGVQPTSWSPAVEAVLASGEAVVQDEGAQLCVELMGPLPGGRIWDACAGQGVKTIQLLDQLAAAGLDAEVVASDLHQNKLERLRKTVAKVLPGLVGQRGSEQPGDEVSSSSRRLVTIRDDLRVAAERGRFDAVLVDAPCTGLGLLGRHPDTRWRRTPEDVDTLAALQAEILATVSKHVAPGGVLLYAVCTTTEAETHGQVTAFLAANPEFSVAPPTGFPTALLDENGRMELHPHVHGTDGFFAVRFQRKEA